MDNNKCLYSCGSLVLGVGLIYTGWNVLKAQKKTLGWSLIAGGLAVAAYSVYMLSGQPALFGQDSKWADILKCRVEMYSMRGCPWCDKAKQRLKSAQIKYTEHEFIRGKHAQPSQMPDGSLPESFPTIWVNGMNKGGYEEMDAWMAKCK